MSMKSRQICKYRTVSLPKIHHLEELVCLSAFNSRELTLCLHFRSFTEQFLGMCFSSKVLHQTNFLHSTISPFSILLLGSIRRILSRVTASGYIFRLTFRSLSDVLYSDECRTKKAFSMSK